MVKCGTKMKVIPNEEYPSNIIHYYGFDVVNKSDQALAFEHWLNNLYFKKEMTRELVKRRIINNISSKDLKAEYGVSNASGMVINVLKKLAKNQEFMLSLQYGYMNFINKVRPTLVDRKLIDHEIPENIMNNIPEGLLNMSMNDISKLDIISYMINNNCNILATREYIEIIYKYLQYYNLSFNVDVNNIDLEEIAEYDSDTQCAIYEFIINYYMITTNNIWHTGARYYYSLVYPFNLCYRILSYYNYHTALNLNLLAVIKTIMYAISYKTDINKQIIFEKYMSHLKGRYKEVIELRFRYGYSLKEMGKKLGVSSERARQLENLSLHKLVLMHTDVMKGYSSEDELLKQNINFVGFSTRTLNCLIRARYNYVYQIYEQLRNHQNTLVYIYV